MAPMRTKSADPIKDKREEKVGNKEGKNIIIALNGMLNFVRIAKRVRSVCEVYADFDRHHLAQIDLALIEHFKNRLKCAVQTHLERSIRF